MRRFFANIICCLVPSKIARGKVRGIIGIFGLRNYFHALRGGSGQKFKYNLSVCAIAKNEGCYFHEWIAFHRLVGVEKFYIYDNESADDTKAVLAPYVAEGIVEYISWPGEKQQIPAYADCVARSRHETRWLALIDLDEFIVPEPMENISDFLRSLPENVSQLSLKALHYGSSGHKVKPEGLVMENYTHRAPDDLMVFGKAIVRPSHVIRVGNHISEVIRRTVDTGGNDYHDSYGWEALPSDTVRVNHYHCKSLEEYAGKHARGDARFGKDNNNYTEKHFQRKDRNDIRDPMPEKYAARVKEMLMQSDKRKR